MGHQRRTASEIAEQQLERLTTDAGNVATDRSGHHTAALADVLVMGNDQRPYMVRSLVDRDGIGAQLCWVSVSAAGWTRRLCHPVIRIAVISEPRSEVNTPATPPGATVPQDIDG